MDKFNFLTLGMPQLEATEKTIVGMGWDQFGKRMKIEFTLRLVPLTIIERYEVGERSRKLWADKFVKGQVEEFQGVTYDLLFQACSCEAMQIKACGEDSSVYNYIDLIMALQRSETVWDAILDAMGEVNHAATQLGDDEATGEKSSPLSQAEESTEK